METTPRLIITSSYSLWLVGFGLILALSFSIWSYRHVWPPAARWIRYTLIFLRWGALSCGIVVLTQPVIELHRSFLRPANVALLLDRSASMALSDDKIDREQYVRDFLKSDGYQSFRKRHNMISFSFADSLSSFWKDAETILLSAPVGVQTDIGNAFASAIDHLLPEEISAMILITDGAHNDGPNPEAVIQNANAPVWSVGVGSPEPPIDVMILGISVNPVVYQGSRIPVDVRLRAVGVEGETVVVSIVSSSGHTLDSEILRIAEDYEETTVSFEMEVKEAGRFRYSVEAQPLEGELTNRNNRRSFYLNVLASRMRVLLMAGPPDNSLGDLVRRLRKDEHIELITRISNGNRFYEGEWPDDALFARIDAVILHHFPVGTNPSEKVAYFAKQVGDANLPVGFIDGGQVSRGLLQRIEDLLPTSIKSGRFPLQTGSISVATRHAIVTDPENDSNSDYWATLPPLKFQNNFTVKPQAQILAEFNVQGQSESFPAVVVLEKGDQKSVAILGQDLWRWGMASPGEDGILEPMLERLVRWLVVRNINKQVEIKFDKELYSNQERVGFSVTVNDENYQPIDGAVLSTEVLLNGEVGGGTTTESVGKGRYRGAFQPWGEGEYIVRVNAVFENVNLGSDLGKIAVEPFNIELLDTRMNEELLKKLGELSNGGYVPIGAADSVFQSLEFPPELQNEEHRWELWGRGWLLMLVIGLLAVEWFIRVRLGML